MRKSCQRASLAPQQLFPIQILLYLEHSNRHQILYSNATDLKLGSFTSSGIHKVLSLRVGGVTLSCERPTLYY